jgi:hypothetical protein
VYGKFASKSSSSVPPELHPKRAIRHKSRSGRFKHLGAIRPETADKQGAVPMRTPRAEQFHGLAWRKWCTGQVAGACSFGLLLPADCGMAFALIGTHTSKSSSIPTRIFRIMSASLFNPPGKLGLGLFFARFTFSENHWQDIVGSVPHQSIYVAPVGTSARLLALSHDSPLARVVLRANGRYSRGEGAEHPRRESFDGDEHFAVPGDDSLTLAASDSA